jgi:hypothetical protein
MSAWSKAIVVALVMSILRHRSTERAERRSDQVIFRPRLAVRVIFFVGIPFCVFGSLSALFEIPGDRQWGVSAGFLGFIVFNLVCWPGKIVVDSRGVRQIWLGISRQRVEWSQIKSAAYLEADNYVVIKTAEGRGLRTSSVHIDPEGLVNELKKHIRVDISRVKYV